VPGEELKRDGFDVVLDEILAADAETEMAERKEAVAGASFFQVLQ